MEELFLQHKSAPPLTKNQPPVAGAIHWSDSLFRKGMRRCGTDGPPLCFDSVLSIQICVGFRLKLFTGCDVAQLLASLASWVSSSQLRVYDRHAPPTNS